MFIIIDYDETFTASPDLWIDDRPMYIWQNRDVKELPD